ncbi:tetratricopeptide repeat protein [Bacteroides ilei]|uniref:tetratricopeptide repeat protein n=1 Tax=Bacteroides ilei TaxID=1907658 RepID=UPI003AB1EEF9
MNKKYALALMALCCTGTAFTQTLQQAKDWFLEGEFAKAKPVFQKLVKQAPSNANYNFWYGACCYETGAREEALPYLQMSAKRRVINAYLYVARLYNDMYRFEDAMENLELYISMREKKKEDPILGEEEMERSRLGDRMLKGTEKVVVVDSFVVDKDQFLTAFKLGSQAGTVSMNEDGVTTSYTNEMDDKKIITQASGDGTALYSSIRLIDRWSTPEPLKGGITEEGTDLNYPFVASDGITLYYAAKGKESLGGYDIFVTRYDSESNSYFRPDNMGMPFNSPYNDYMYAIDDVHNLGWFASDRFQPEGKVCVYVFVPNESKETYDYENTDLQAIIADASLRSISSTWTDKDKLRLGKQQLAQVKYAGEEQQRSKGDFRFVINDTHIYHTLEDFRSGEAREMFQQYRQTGKDLAELETSLDKLRTDYSKSNVDGKAQLAPGILDKEKRVKEMQEGLARMAKDIRNTELQKIK